MKSEKERLFTAMVRAMEECNEKELQYIIAKIDRDAAVKAYKEYDGELCSNLAAGSVG